MYKLNLWGWRLLVKYCDRDIFQQASLIYYYVWIIWKKRNASTFKGKVSGVKAMVHKAATLAEERIAVLYRFTWCMAWRCWELVELEQFHGKKKKDNRVFQAQFHWFFFFFLNPCTRIAAAGFVVRDWERQLLFAEAHK